MVILDLGVTKKYSVGQLLGHQLPGNLEQANDLVLQFPIRKIRILIIPFFISAFQEQ